MHFSAVVSISLLAGANLVAGHAAIIKAVGDAGGAGSAIGVDPTTPRDGQTRTPFQQDSTRFRNAGAATCGETLAGGTNDVETGTQTMMTNMGSTLPQISAGGSVMMTLHQVNADGAGPYSCMIDSTGAGTTWTPIMVTTNVAGNAKNGRNQANAEQDLPLTVAIPAGQTCTGTVAGQDNVCMVKCVNPATAAGPFGGCVPVQMAGAVAAAGSSTTSAAAAGATKATTTKAAAATATSKKAAATNKANQVNNRRAAKSVRQVEDDVDEDDEEEELEDNEEDYRKFAKRFTV